MRPLNGSYLIIIDSFTRWPEIFKYRRPIKVIHELFLKLRVPDTIVSDNATQFISGEFKNFCKCYTVEHVTHTYHPKTNGQAENFINTFKRGFKENK